MTDASLHLLLESLVALARDVVVLLSHVLDHGLITLDALNIGMVTVQVEEAIVSHVYLLV